MLRQARTLSPTDPLVEIRLARSQQEAGKGDDAIKTLQGAVTKFPKEPAVKLSLASTLERERKYADAEAMFRQMIADDPKNPDRAEFTRLHARRARTEAGRGGRPRAAARLSIDPATAPISIRSGWAYYKQNRLEQAEAAAERSGQEAARCVGDSGSLWRCPQQARLARGSDRRLAEGARRRRRLYLPLRDRRQDQVGAPETWPKKVSSPSRSSFSRSVRRRVEPRACRCLRGRALPRRDFAPAYAAGARGVRGRADAAGRVGSVGPRRRSADARPRARAASCRER